MKRESGFYWIKYQNGDDYEVAEFVQSEEVAIIESGFWMRTGSDYIELIDPFLVDEIRIINPNE